MSKKKDSGIKSAYELAMGRLEKSGGGLRELTEEQKTEIARVDGETKAKLAEIEFMMEGQLAEARATGDPAKLSECEDEKVAEMANVRARGEEEKDRIREQ